MEVEKKKRWEDLKVIELFAGVGGFRLGLEGYKSEGKGYFAYGNRPRKGFRVVWANQWEPGLSPKAQHAAMVYRARFHGGKEPNESFNEDINKVAAMNKLPDGLRNNDLLVGGFPCQDYSVARTLSQAAGIEGKKGVLWWAIYNILSRLGKKEAPKYLMLENVDRLLKSPANQRGRDFGIILASLNKLGYAVEWRVINAADYGMPQRRRRTFILGYKEGTPIYRRLKKSEPEKWLFSEGTMARAFKILPQKDLELDWNPIGEISNSFEFPFENTGLMIGGKFTTIRTAAPEVEKKNKITLGSILWPEKLPIDDQSYFLPEDNKKIMGIWKDLKNGGKRSRRSKNGFKYEYSEGAMAFPDKLKEASRTIVTGEGGQAPSRFKHVVEWCGRLRRLLPVELEKLCMFPPDFTKLDGVSDVKRAFFMGNALVVGVIERLGKSLLQMHRNGRK